MKRITTIEERFILGCGRCRSDDVMKINVGIHCFKCGHIGDIFESTYLIGGNDDE